MVEEGSGGARGEGFGVGVRGSGAGAGAHRRGDDTMRSGASFRASRRGEKGAAALCRCRALPRRASAGTTRGARPSPRRCAPAPIPRPRGDPRMNYRIVVVDNYDSFTWNLVQALYADGREVIVRRNDAVDADSLEELAPTHLVVSPGPGRPEDAGATCAIVERW